MRRWGQNRLVTALNGTLQRIINRSNPISHIFFQRSLINPLKLRRDNFKAEPSLLIPRHPHRRHAQVNRIHVQIELLFPVAVLGELPAIKHDPESAKVSTAHQGDVVGTILVPGLLIDPLWIDVRTGPGKRPQQSLLLLRSYNNDIKQADSKKKDFEEESRDYYAYLGRYLGQRQDSLKEKKRVESDSKYQTKRRNFELKRFDYSSFMHGLHGGRKEHELLYHLTKYADTQAMTYLKTAKKIEEMVPQLEALKHEVAQADST